MKTVFLSLLTTLILADQTIQLKLQSCILLYYTGRTRANAAQYIKNCTKPVEYDVMYATIHETVYKIGGVGVR